MGIIMEGIQSFFEFSTIHGLSYISTSRKFVRLFWIMVVIAGFTGAGVLIYTSFQSWDESPVKTTIETLPIRDFKFPKLTVCPPKDTYTNLNYGLSMTKNMTLDNDTRKELATVAKKHLHQHLYAATVKNLRMIEEKEIWSPDKTNGLNIFEDVTTEPSLVPYEEETKVSIRQIPIKDFK